MPPGMFVKEAGIIGSGKRLPGYAEAIRSRALRSSARIAKITICSFSSLRSRGRMSGFQPPPCVAMRPPQRHSVKNRGDGRRGTIDLPEALWETKSCRGLECCSRRYIRL
jgi:hypothetical protein